MARQYSVVVLKDEDEDGGEVDVSSLIVVGPAAGTDGSPVCTSDPDALSVDVVNGLSLVSVIVPPVFSGGAIEHRSVYQFYMQIVVQYEETYNRVSQKKGTEALTHSG